MLQGTSRKANDGTGGPDQPKAPGVLLSCREPTPGPCPAAGRTSQKLRNRESQSLARWILEKEGKATRAANKGIDHAREAGPWVAKARR
jgi:hypothetical protein